MKKDSPKEYVILGFLFALVSIISFAIPTLKTTTFWIAYVFTAVAFAAQIGIWKNAFGKEDTLKSKFFGFSVVYIGISYTIIQVVVFAVFMFAPTLPTWSAIVVCTVIGGISAVCMIATDAGRSEIEQVEEKGQKRVFYIREHQADVELLADHEKDSDVKAALTQLAEKFAFPIL